MLTVARAIGGPHQTALSGSVSHRYPALDCLIGRQVPPVARTRLLHREAVPPVVRH